MDVSKLATLGWTARIALREGLEKTYAAYQAAVATKAAIVSEQRARFNARSLARDARVATLLGR